MLSWDGRALLLLVALAPSAPAEDWLMYLRDPAHSSSIPGTSAPGKDSLNALQPAWTASWKGGLAAAVTVADGVLYFGDWAGNFRAVDAATGEVMWTQFVGLAPAPEDPSCFPSVGVSSQATVDNTTVYVGGGDSAVYALDRATGELRWRVPLADPNSGAYLWSSLTLYHGALYLGVASLADCPLVPGQLVRIDLASPQQPLVRYLTPADGDGGGGMWSTPAIDAETNTVFITTGNGDQNPDAGAWGSTFASFDADTLDLKSYYFLPINPDNADDGDIEWGSSPSLFTTPDGTKLIAATGKDGNLYALRRDDLTPAWITRIAISCVCPECGCGSLSTPAFDGQTLFVGAGVSNPDAFASGTVWAIDPATGAPIWQTLTDGVVLAPVTVANGLVYASTTKGLNIFNAQTGDLVWTDQNWGMLYSQPVIADGKVYCSYVKGEVVAWALPPPQIVPRPSRHRPSAGRSGEGSVYPPPGWR